MDTPSARAPHGDEGFALVAVLGALAVLSLFLLGSLAFAMEGMPRSREDQDGKAALAAAQAGVDDYLSRLNVNGDYWRTTDSTNTAYTTGLPVPGTGTTNGSFTYRLLSTEAEVLDTGQLRLEVTGRSRGETRKVTAAMQPVGFLKYVYYTDVEAIDPALYSQGARARVDGSDGYSCQGGKTCTYHTDPPVMEAMCSRYYYSGRTTDLTYTSSSSQPYWVYNPHFNSWTKMTDTRSVQLRDGCRNPQWLTGDVVDGPLHSNDALQITGSVLFKHPSTESSWADTHTPAPPSETQRWWGSGTPDSTGHRPIFYPPVALPDSNTQLLNVATSVGCVYTGATKITFVDGSMKVRSPNTTTINRSVCFDPANRANEQTITPIPPVIYVQPSTGSCTGVGYPIPNETANLGNNPSHVCTNGNAYVSGRLQGSTTVGAENEIVIVGNTTYKNGTSGGDVLGLVANKNVWVYHPVRDTGSTTCTPYPHCRGENLLTASQEVHDIQAAILSVRHSFLVQAVEYGAQVNAGGQKLNVTGAIAQKFRGPVGHTTRPSGYLKNYVYDKRLLTIPPPYFLKPKQSPWYVAKLTG